MSIGSGLAASFGVAAETTYGTYVAPSRFLQVDKAEVKKVKNIAQGGGLAAGRMVRAGSRRVVASEAGTASWDKEVTNKNMGLLLQALMGTTVTPVQQGATAAYLQTHTLADNVGKSLSVQLGVPDTTGTVRPYTGLGAKITSAEFACSGPDGLLTSTFEADLKQVVESQTLAAPSYTTGTMPFHFGQMNVKLGTFASEASVSGVKGCSIRIERGQNTERFYAGATVAGTKAEPLMNDYVSISGSFDVDFVDKTTFADRFASDASTSLIVEWVGPLIASTYFQTFRIKVPMIFLDEGTPTVEGPDLTSTSFAFTGQFDETNAACTIEYISTDTTV